MMMLLLHFSLPSRQPVETSGQLYHSNGHQSHSDGGSVLIVGLFGPRGDRPSSFLMKLFQLIDLELFSIILET